MRKGLLGQASVFFVFCYFFWVREGDEGAVLFSPEAPWVGLPGHNPGERGPPEDSRALPGPPGCVGVDVSIKTPLVHARFPRQT